MSRSAKTVLITGGSDGGIGWALAHEFHQRGHVVYAGLRNPQKAGGLAELPNVRIVTLDVTDKASIDGALEFIKKEVGNAGLDILINNAGHGAPMPLLDANLHSGRQLFDVNFWGVLQMVQTFTPLLIKARGTVVNISSVGSIIYTPYIGLYDCSKAAVTMASNTLRLELKPLGVKVVNVMAGMVKTKFGDNLQEIVLPEDSHYKNAESFIQTSPGTTGSDMGRLAMPVDKFAQKVVGDILNGASGHIFRGGMATMSRILKWILPTWLLDFALSQNRGLDLISKPQKEF